MSESRTATQVAAMKEALREVRKDWLRRPGVTALDVGFKMVDWKLTDRIAIRVHVKRKLPVDQLPIHEVFPRKLGAFDVDVIEAEYGPQADLPEAL